MIWGGKKINVGDRKLNSPCDIHIQENHKVNFSHFFGSGKNSSDFRQFPIFIVTRFSR